MSQATTWSVPLSGPVSPDVFAQRIDESLDALLSSNSGSSRPTYAAAGTVWISTATAGKLKKYIYDGANDRLLQTIDIATGAISYEGANLLDPVFAPASAPTKKAAFDLSLITAGQQRKIWVPDADVALDKWEFIRTVSGSGTPTQVVFADLANFETVKVYGAISGSAATSALLYRVSVNNGSSFESGASDYSVQVRTIQNNTPTGASSTALSSIQVGPATGFGNRAFIDLTMVQFNKAVVTQIDSRIGGLDAAGAPFKTDSWGQRNSATADNAFSLFVSAGTFLTWDLKVVGVRG